MIGDHDDTDQGREREKKKSKKNPDDASSILHQGVFGSSLREGGGRTARTSARREAELVAHRHRAW